MVIRNKLWYNDSASAESKLAAAGFLPLCGR